MKVSGNIIISIPQSMFSGYERGASLESRSVDLSSNSCLIMSLNITSVIYWKMVGEASSAAHFPKSVPHMDWKESEDRNWWKSPTFPLSPDAHVGVTWKATLE